MKSLSWKWKISEMETAESSPKILQRWDVFSKWQDEELEKIVYAKIFGTDCSDFGRNLNLGALVLTKDDAVFRIGHELFGGNLSDISLGEAGVEVPELTGLGLKKIEVGDEFCVALTVNGSLYRWGKPPSLKEIPASAFVCYGLLDSASLRCDLCYRGGYGSTYTINVLEFAGLKFKNGCPGCLRYSTTETYSLGESEGKYVARLVKFSDARIRCTKCHRPCSAHKIGNHEVNYCNACNYLPQDATHFRSIDANERHTELLDLGESNKVVAIACGEDLFVALTVKNDLIVWGPIADSQFEGPAYNPDDVKLKAVSCGGDHIAVLSVEGDLYTCGLGDRGQLGYVWTPKMGYETLRKVPLGRKVVKVCCGYTSTVCLMDDGSLMGFGSHMKLLSANVLALNQARNDFISEPARIMISKKVTDIANSPLTNIYFAKTDSFILSWGNASDKWRQPKMLLGGSDLTAAMANLPAAFTFKAPRAQQSTIGPLLDSELYGKKFLSDLTIKLSDGEFPAHRLILHTNSAYFREAFDGNNTDSLLDMTHYNPEAYKCLLKYFYQVPPSDLDPPDLLDLYVLANSYKETDIAQEVFAKLKATLSSDTALPLLRKAKEVNCPEFLEVCNVFIQSPEFTQKLAEKVSKDVEKTLTVLEVFGN